MGYGKDEAIQRHRMFRGSEEKSLKKMNVTYIYDVGFWIHRGGGNPRTS